MKFIEHIQDLRKCVFQIKNEMVANMRPVDLQTKKAQKLFTSRGPFLIRKCLSVSY